MRTLAIALVLAVLPALVGATEYFGGNLRAIAHFDIGRTDGSKVAVPGRNDAAGDVYFSNIATPTGDVILQGPAANVGSNGMTRLVADDITGVLPGGSVIELTFSVVNQNAVTVTCRPRLRFWSANGAGGTPGTYLGSLGLTFPAFPFPPGVTIAAGGVPSGLFPMPGSKFWAGVVFDNDNGSTGATLTQLGNIGQALFDPPTIGSSTDVLFETSSAGSFLGVNNPAGARVSQASGPRVSAGWRFTDVPCPTITATAGANGSISPSGSVLVACGADQSFSITPAVCYRIADVLVDGASVGPVPTYTFPNVTADHTIEASFALGNSGPGDRDGDGLLDAWETNGIPDPQGGGGVFMLPGADPDHKDLYVEVDAMTGMAPEVAELQRVVAAFNSASSVCNPDHTSGIRLHVIGTGCDPCVDESNLAPEGWGEYFNATEPPTSDFYANKIKPIRDLHFGTEAEQSAPLRESIMRARALGVRYCIFGVSFTVNGQWRSGIRIGDDFVVTLGGGHFGAGDPDKRAGTFMHEFGHSLGLLHGGADEENWKTNYPSVMNYLWQMPSPNQVGLKGADARATYASSWRLDYSGAGLNILDKRRLNEFAGIGGDPTRYVPVGSCASSPLQGRRITLAKMSGPVDWDHDEKADNMSVSRNINEFLGYTNPIPGLNQPECTATDILYPHDDWSSLIYHTKANVPSPEVAMRFAALEVDAIDELTSSEFDSLGTFRLDCNANDVPDDEEIADGLVPDVDGNGIPDPCESPATPLGVDDSRWSASKGLKVIPMVGGAAHEVRYVLPERGRTALRMYDLGGRVVATLVMGVAEAGEHRVVWRHDDAAGRPVGSGVYFIELQSGQLRESSRIVVVK